MDTNSLKHFFSQLFTELTVEDSIVVLIFLTVSFLIGLLFGWWQGRRGKRKLRKALKEKESKLITLQAEYEMALEQVELKEADLTKANLATEELKTTISSIQHEKAQLDSDLFEASNQMQALKAENLTNLSQIEALNAQIVNLESTAAEQVHLLESTTTNAAVDIDLSEVQSNYDNANLRLMAVEEKLNRMERENSTLKTEIASMKDSTSIAFVDDEPGDNDEELIVEEIIEDNSNEILVDPNERSALAKQKIKAAFGSRIAIASADEKDDLKRINGIGPFIEQKLNDIGIFTFKQVSQFDADLIQQITDAIQFFPGRIDRDDWVGQAKQLS